MLDFVDRFDLTGVHVIATLLGMFLSIYASLVMWQDSESQRDSRFVRLGRRIMYPMLALAFLWALDYSHIKNWTPWPPNVAITVAMDFIIVMRILALRARQKEISRRWAIGVSADSRPTGA